MIRDQLIRRWQSLEFREKNILLAGAVILVLIVIYLFLEPALERRDRLQSDLPRMREDLVWMQAQVSELQQLLGTNAGRPSDEPLSVALVEDLLRQSGIHEQVTELRPVEQTVSLRFDDVSYSGLIQFLSALTSRTAVRVGTAGIRRLETTGHVEASLTLKPDSGP